MIKLELTVEQVNTILASLGRMPYEAVAALITEVQRQGNSQIDAQKPADVAVAEKN